MWNADPYLGKAASAVLIFIFIWPMAVDLYWAPFLNWATIASKNIFWEIDQRRDSFEDNLTDLYLDRFPGSTSQAYIY